MEESINQVLLLAQKSAEFMHQTGTAEIVKKSASGLFKWLRGILTKKSAKEKLALIEENKANAEIISGLRATLEYVLEDNSDLQEQLKSKIKELEEVFNKHEPNLSGKTTATVTFGDNSSDNIVISGITSGKDTNLNITR